MTNACSYHCYGSVGTVLSTVAHTAGLESFYPSELAATCYGKLHQICLGPELFFSVCRFLFGNRTFWMGPLSWQLRTKCFFQVCWKPPGKESLIERNFLNQFKAKMETRVLCQNSSHRKVCSTPSTSAQRGRCLSSWTKTPGSILQCNGFSFIGRMLALSRKLWKARVGR